MCGVKICPKIVLVRSQLMSHGLHNSVNILRRWSHRHDGPLPENWKQFQEANMNRAMEIEQADPQLVALLKGTAGAGLRAGCADREVQPHGANR